MKSRVFVVEYDVISPLGAGREENWQSLKSDYLAGKALSHFRAEGLPAVHAAEVADAKLPPLRHFSNRLRDAASVDRKLLLSLSIGARVRERFKACLENVEPDRRGIVFGIGIEVTPMEFLAPYARQRRDDPHSPYFRALYDLNARSPSRLDFIANPLDVSALALAHDMELGAFQKTVLTSCSASLQSVAFACEAIRRGEADFVVAGGSDSLLNLVGYIAFSRLGVVSKTDGPLEKACKPFDVNRGGVLVGEGSGLILLASEEGLRRSGREPLFEMMGWGSSMDAYKITAPDPEGVGMRRAMDAALKSAGDMPPADVDYVNLHGTGTQANDPAELNAIKGSFGDAASDLAISSTKDRHGHAIGAAGVVELGVLFLSMEHGFVPCTRNLEKPILSEGVNLVRGRNLSKKIRVGMSNSFALGGVNASIVVKNLGSG